MGEMVTCVRCGEEMKAARAVTEMQMGLRVQGLPVKVFGNRSDELLVRVCRSCGVVEWYMGNPEKFR